MEIYIGGYAQGKTIHIKKKYPNKKILEAVDSTEEECMHADVINHFHLYIRSFLGNEAAAMESAERIIARNPSVIIICDEVGCGVVPLDRAEREYRETVGRVMCMLTQHANKVLRIICGIEMQIK